MKNPLQIVFKILAVSPKGEVNEVRSKLAQTVPSEIINSPGIISSMKKELEKFLSSQSHLALLPDSELIEPKELNAHQLRQLADRLEEKDGATKVTVYHLTSNNKHIHIELNMKE